MGDRQEGGRRVAVKGGRGCGEEGVGDGRDAGNGDRGAERTRGCGSSSLNNSSSSNGLRRKWRRSAARARGHYHGDGRGAGVGRGSSSSNSSSRGRCRRLRAGGRGLRWKRSPSLCGARLAARDGDGDAPLAVRRASTAPLLLAVGEHPLQTVGVVPCAFAALRTQLTRRLREPQRLKKKKKKSQQDRQSRWGGKSTYHVLVPGRNVWPRHAEGRGEGGRRQESRVLYDGLRQARAHWVGLAGEHLGGREAARPRLLLTQVAQRGQRRRRKKTIGDTHE